MNPRKRKCALLSCAALAALILTVPGRSDATAGCVYSEDFSSAPVGWVTNNASNFYWDSANEAYFFRQDRGSGEYAYVELPFVGASFRLEFDVLPSDVHVEHTDLQVEITSAPEVMTGGDPTGHAYIQASYNPRDTGPLYFTHVVGDTVKYAQQGPDSFVEGRWYHHVFEYDAYTNTAYTRRTDSETSEVIELTVTGGPEFGDSAFRYLSLVVHPTSTPEYDSSGYLDNVRFYTIPEPSMLCALALALMAAIRSRTR
jgi:hypothetical protein